MNNKKAKTYPTLSARVQDRKAKWIEIDAQGAVVGRLATQVATLLRGKDKPWFTPHLDCGDHVIVVNAAGIRFTGKKEVNKQYLRYTGHPGGQRSRTPILWKKKDPNAPFHHAVKGMLPKNRLGRQVLRKLTIYQDANHPHEAQKPEKRASLTS